MKRFLTLLPAAALVLGACGSSDDAAGVSVTTDSTGVSVTNAWARASAPGQTSGAVYFDLTAGADDVLLGASVPASVAADAQVHEVVMADMTDDTMAGMTETTMAGMTDETMAGMTETTMAGMTDDTMAGMTETTMAGMTDDSMSGMDHPSTTPGSGSMDHAGDMDGAMTMRELTAGLPLAAGQTVSFEPGSYHVMLFDLAEPLAVGDQIELTLDLKNAGPTVVTVEVAESAP
jgi:copper(I)-binding protein